MYSDINPNFTDPKELICTDLRAVINSFITILNTLKDSDGISERPFRPKVGAQLYQLLYDNINEITAFRIYNYLLDIAKQEKRVELVRNKTSVTPDVVNQCYYINICLRDIITNEEEETSLIINKP